MATLRRESGTPAMKARCGSLPARMRVLYITTYHRTGGWLAEAFASDSAVDVVLEEAVGMAAGLARLRDESFDAVLVSHEPGEMDAIELLDGLRAAGSEDPIVVLGSQSEQELAALCFEVGADAYVCVTTTTTRNLIWMVARSVERHQLLRENRRLAQAERQRLRSEHDEAQRLLDEQRAVLRELEGMQAEGNPSALPPAGASGESVAGADVSVENLPPALFDHYRELLKAYVIMGSGNLSLEMSSLGELLSSAGISGRETMQLHLQVLEELVRGLGTRSARHVMTRADLLIVEVLVHLAEGYRQRWLARRHPRVQLTLPGFSAATQAAALPNA